MKTMFVSISNPPVYRNFALFPNSVVEQISNDKNYRMVLLVRKNLFPKFVEEHKSKFVIEEFEESQKRTLIQKLFYFFYSYLIFTDTTMLVSSYGVRADKPRPLYKYWNFPFKLLLANTLGKSKWVKEKFVPRLYFYVYRDRPYQYLFDKYLPERVFLTNICIWPADLEFLIEAKRLGIKSVGMPANWDHLSKYYIPFKPDKLLVWSPQVKYEALKFQGYKEKDIKMVGAPQLDFLLNPENIAKRSDVLKKFGFPENAKLLTFFSQGPYSLDGADLINMILQWINAGELPKNTYIVIRPHPSGLKEIDKYLPFKENPRIYIDDVEGWSSIPRVVNYLNLLYHSDIVLTTYSSIAAEASIYDNPTIIAGFDGYKNRPLYQSVRRHAKFTHFQYLLPIGGIKVVLSQEEMLKAIKTYFAQPQADSEKRKKLAEEVFGFLDGKNVSRITDEVLKD